MSSSKMVYNIEFLRGFKWAVPTAFSSAISQCQFEEGDILYDSKEAYQEWNSALNNINKVIQVRSAPAVKEELIENEPSVIFDKNWYKAIDIDVTNIKDNQNRKKISTTQGRLLTYLIHDNPKVLGLDTDEPEIPILLKDAKRFMIETIESGLKIRNKQVSKIKASNILDESILDCFKKNILNSMKKPNIFIMPYDISNNTSVTKFREISNRLSDIFNTIIYELTPKDCAISKYDRLFPTITFKCIAIDSGKSEAIRDIIKNVLWPKRDSKNASKSINEILTRLGSSAGNAFKLSRHGIFYSFKLNKNKDKGIRTHSFERNNHFIRYRVSLDKLSLSPRNLQTYLELQFTDCPNHLFIDSDFSASKVQADFDVQVTHSDNHELISFARDSRDFNEVKSRHENLEKYFLNHDYQSIACEVPVWIESGEFKDYFEVFKTTQNLTGHIDLLRYKANGKIEIWDYKPGAFKDKKAKSQVFLYAFMLATRSGISLNNILCGYFDEIDAFYFEPSEIKSFEIT